MESGGNTTKEKEDYQFYYSVSSSEESMAPTISLDPNEVQSVLSFLVNTDKTGSKSINYNALIPVLIKAINELQQQVTFLQTTVSQDEIVTRALSNDNDNDNFGLTGAFLGQNVPNPVNGVTSISYQLPDKCMVAGIYFYDLSGQQIDYEKLNTKIGEGHVNINSSRFKPGIYLYTLIVDGKEIETKRMVVIK